MKVNTDGVLLGAAMTVRPDDRCLLDIGTGTGTIALMAAQRMADVLEKSFVGTQDDRKYILNDDVILSEAKNPYEIDAIDIDEPSATEAATNFAESPWTESLHAHNLSLNEFAAGFPEKKYDLIFSNPPYFEDSLTAPDERKSTAMDKYPASVFFVEIKYRLTVSVKAQTNKRLFAFLQHQEKLEMLVFAVLVFLFLFL